MIRVLRIINRFNLGGITYNVSYLSRYLPEEYETTLIGGPEEDGEESSLYIPRGLGLDPLVIGEMRRSINPLSDYFAYRRIKKIIRTFRPHIVHTHASKAGAVGRLAAAHCGVPVIVHTFHGHVFSGYFSGIKAAVLKSIERYLARKSTAIVAISAIQKKELTETHRICAPDKMAVIPLGFDLQKFSEHQAEKRALFRKKYRLDDAVLAIGIIGRLVPIKNHRLFIDAVCHVLQHSSRRIRVLIIGDGTIRQDLMDYIEQKKVSYSTNPDDEAVFIFAGWSKEVDVALAGLDLVALSSRNEGTPVSLIEAQAAGRFIVSTDVGGIRDILHPDCGLLCEADDRQSYLNNLLLAVEKFDHYNQKAGAAQKEVIERFGYKRLCRDMDALYKRVLTNDR